MMAPLDPEFSPGLAAGAPEAACPVSGLGGVQARASQGAKATSQSSEKNKKRKE